MNVGWDPMVTQVLATYDGGKAILGFGKIGYHSYAGWLVKMWGTRGTTACADNQLITGYTQMAVGLGQITGTDATDCGGTSPKVMWMYSTQLAAGIGETTTFTYIFLDVDEDWKYGDAGSDGTKPEYLVVGGS